MALNTDTAGLVTEGVEVQIGDGQDPENFVTIGEILSFDGPGGAGSIIDMTHVNAPARLKRPGLPDEGQFSFQANLAPSDLQQRQLIEDRQNRAERNFRVLLTDAAPTTLEFAGFVQEFSVAGAVDDKISANAAIEISGLVTWTY